MLLHSCKRLPALLSVPLLHVNYSVLLSVHFTCTVRNKWMKADGKELTLGDKYTLYNTSTISKYKNVMVV